MMDDELYHHGVKGMKWGVRRYRNYDGSYTQAGVKRFDKSLGDYEKADARYKYAKKAYKATKKNGSYHDPDRNADISVSKAVVTNSKIARKAAKRKLEKDYRHLKQDKLGDQGKELYARGKTITGNNQIRNTLAAIGSLSFSALAYSKNGGTTGIRQIDSNKATINKMLAAVGAASYAGAGIKGATDAYQNKRLRAYYGHTSNY